MALSFDPTHDLHDEDFDVEQGDETEFSCEACWENIRFPQSLVLISVKQAFIGNTNTIQIVDVQDEDGDFEIEPLFVHEACWHEQIEELLAYVEDTRDRNTVMMAQHGTPPGTIFRCDACADPIEAYEKHVHAVVGRFVVERLDETEFSATPGNDPSILCMHCANWLDVNCFERWTEEGSYEEDEE